MSMKAFRVIEIPSDFCADRASILARLIENIWLASPDRIVIKGERNMMESVNAELAMGEHDCAVQLAIMENEDTLFLVID